ncbi:unnamed protein product (macronuclear) [Paramecium tetraurelia]|uniref:Ribosomal protein eL8/eL30/eS12/Gadd45 domain-containing protein n=1 Tax=Paramecium tetraurelia TaxID=5888 RepID=A0EFR5_PARTE|nr:uncharacterized protein GSPATT00026479001 [Paramecium tetraurelia]CAK94156.1 unnamed protein product [Paramecium tetraurelia]|eukprot:XP_001461529.1 hypothetical protein (macronuclear) [Paramecium tetraurelia strain d4-2]
MYELSQYKDYKVYLLLRNYAPKMRTDKKYELIEKVNVLNFGLHHVTTFVQTNKSKQVLIVYDVDPIKLAKVPLEFIKNKQILGGFIHSKTAIFIALIKDRKEDQVQFDNVEKNSIQIILKGSRFKITSQ